MKFDQGVDARYLTEEKIELLSQIPIRPLRIAFDELKIKKKDDYNKEVQKVLEYYLIKK